MSSFTYISAHLGYILAQTATPCSAVCVRHLTYLFNAEVNIKYANDVVAVCILYTGVHCILSRDNHT